MDYKQRHYIIEIVTFYPKTKWSLTQGHAWLRFISPLTDAPTSYGFFGERPIDGFWQVLRHLIPRKGRILSPDLYETSIPKASQKVTPIALAKDQFDLALSFVHGLQHAQKCSFQLLDTLTGSNCAGFVGAVLRHIGIEVTASQFNLPVDIALWQETVDEWRQRQLVDLLKKDRYPLQDNLDAILYGIPYAP